MRHKVSNKFALFIIRNFDPIARLARRRRAAIDVRQTFPELDKQFPFQNAKNLKFLSCRREMEPEQNFDRGGH